MVVRSNRVLSASLDLGYLGLFLGLRVNALVVDRLIAAGFRRVRMSHGFVIQHLIEADRSITELASRMEVSQQAASKVVAELVRLGLLEVSAGEDRRAKRIRLSRRGWKAVRLGRQTRRRIERRLTKAVGARAYATARSLIVNCLEALGGLDHIGARRVGSAR